ncbi:MAG: hypothetical protein KGM47_17380 [Acidobacteriota bacterium]|nr:hypothetical protein [Acidobacteriota bacterium]
MKSIAATAGWENFYVIVGSSAGALIGLQFVVITLIAGTPMAEGGAQASGAFGTPTIVHFGTALLLSAILSVPWHALATAAVLWGLLGLIELVYEVVAARRMRVQTIYTPDFGDWLFYVLLPSAAYATLAGSAYAARPHVRSALFGVGGAALLLLFIGIHNAWGSVTYHVFSKRQARGNFERKPAG